MAAERTGSLRESPPDVRKSELKLPGVRALDIRRRKLGSIGKRCWSPRDPSLILMPALTVRFSVEETYA